MKLGGLNLVFALLGDNRPAVMAGVLLDRVTIGFIVASLAWPSRASSTGFGVASASFPRAVREDALTDCAAVAVALSGVLDSEPLTANEPLRPLQTSTLAYAPDLVW